MSAFGTLLKRLLGGETLSRRESRLALESVVGGHGTPAQLGALLTALKVRGETYEEILGFAEVMRRHLVPVKVRKEPLVDTCGTGGDGAGTFNISTTAAFIAAGAGAYVAKHGNRSISSRCGSADVLEALGVKADLGAGAVARCVESAGIGFLFAPAYHPALKPLSPVRKELGVRTIFNVLGPMSNPAGPRRQLMGVYDPALTEPVARALGALGSERALVVSALDGLDELSLGAPTVVAEWHRGRLRKYKVDARALGLSPAAPRQLAGGDARRNAAITLEVLSGKKGPKRDVCLLNASAALLAAGLAKDLKDGLALSARSIDTGAARGALARLVERSNA